MKDGMNGMEGMMIEGLKISVVCEEGGREGCEMVVVEGLTMMGLNERNGREGCDGKEFEDCERVEEVWMEGCERV